MILLVVFLAFVLVFLQSLNVTEHAAGSPGALIQLATSRPYYYTYADPRYFGPLRYF